jgi:hypothetical protein
MVLVGGNTLTGADRIGRRRSIGPTQVNDRPCARGAA